MRNDIADGITGAASRVSTDTSYMAAAVNVYLGLTVEQWCLAVGAFCAIGTFVVNWWYRRKDSQLAERIAAKQHGVVIED